VDNDTKRSDVWMIGKTSSGSNFLLTFFVWWWWFFFFLCDDVEQGKTMSEQDRRELAARVALSFGMHLGD